MQYPARFSVPLSDNFVSDGPALRAMVAKYWRMQDGSKLVLEEWQCWLIDAVLERYPDDWHDPDRAGKLRYREGFISMARQNGKSELAAIFSLYGLVWHVKAPKVIGVASSREAADIVYERTKYVVANTRIKDRIKPTGTRGLRYRDGSGSYEIRASSSTALQGLATSLGLCDELHITDPDVWDALVTGTVAQPNGIVIGITTAGDDQSRLLNRLYKTTEQAGERFGFWIWEAPDGATLDTPGALEAANPSIGSGRRKVEDTRDLASTKPEVDQQRYFLNKFVANVSVWIPMHYWTGAGKAELDKTAPITFSVDRTPDWSYAAITAHQKDSDGIIHTHLVASVAQPSQAVLETVCAHIARKNRGAVFVMEGRSLSTLAEALKLRGLQVRTVALNEITQASATAYSLLATGRLKHDNQPLLNNQVPQGKRKNIGDQWRVSKTDTEKDIDGLLAMVYGSFVVETEKRRERSF